MKKTFLYFQPEYVGKFKCDGEKCNARCCKNWRIDIDAATYKKYSKLPEAQEIISQIKFNEELDKYIVTLDEKRFCPMLTEENLCRLQKDHGEELLSVTCSTYPRHTKNFGKFFERALTPTCPVAAELILFQKEPMKFDFVEVPMKIHSNNGKISITNFSVPENDVAVFFEIQVAMISILQERRFTIDQRLIALGFFLDKLQELLSAKADKETLMKSIGTYESEDFLMNELPPLIQSVQTDSEKFILFMLKFLKYTLDCLKSVEGRDFIKAFAEVLEIHPDEKSRVDVPKIISKYESLAEARKDFFEKYSTVLENYFVNEFFMNVYPFRFAEENITKNFAVFMISYKIFELMMFSATQNGLTSEKDLLRLVDWFTAKMDHNKNLFDRFFDLLKGIDDTFLLMTLLLKG